MKQREESDQSAELKQLTSSYTVPRQIMVNKFITTLQAAGMSPDEIKVEADTYSQQLENGEDNDAEQ